MNLAVSFQVTENIFRPIHILMTSGLSEVKPPIFFCVFINKETHYYYYENTRTKNCH